MKTILVPVDYSDVTAAVIENARRIGAAFGSRILLLHVAEPDMPPFEATPGLAIPMSTPAQVAPDRSLDWKRNQLEKEKMRFAGSGLDVTAIVVEGTTVPVILEQSAGADLIILGSHGHGALFHLLAGSTTSGVLKSTHIPVLVVPSPRK